MLWIFHSVCAKSFFSCLMPPVKTDSKAEDGEVETAAERRKWPWRIDGVEV